MSITIPTPTTMSARGGIGVTTTVQVAHNTDEKLGIDLYRIFDGQTGQMVDIWRSGGLVEYSMPHRWTADDFRQFSYKDGWRRCTVKVLAVRLIDGRLDWDYDEIIDMVKAGEVI